MLLHKFHVPVMGLAYTIDSPIKLAPFGISSVISIMEDRLIESMRQYYYNFIGEHYNPITDKEENYREKRITDYLNLVNRIVTEKITQIKKAGFEKGSEIVKYFEMLPESSHLKKLYNEFQRITHPVEKGHFEERLRNSIIPGSVDVNIMTKVDKDNYDKSGNVIENGSDALCALKAFAQSDLRDASVVFSAGMNPRLFNYLEQFPEFDIDAAGQFKKRIIIKVSDYRSALIQGKYLAKKGIWVSEFRIESGLNCGGHAFATDGLLIGPVLEEFKMKKGELLTSLFEMYQKIVLEKKNITVKQPPDLKITVQGGVGTSQENEFLINYYNLASVGWGTPFLLVPEATTVDEHTLKLLQNADEEDVVLSKKSPLGVRFYFLKNTSADIERLDRIEKGRPGSPCTEKLLVSNTEFTERPICTASAQYQKLKLQQLQSLNLSKGEYERQSAEVLDKDCLCINLSNAAPATYKVPFVKKLPAVTICPGPNISYFSKIVSLKEMSDHIYGKNNIIDVKNRPHVFINELKLYVSYFKELVSKNLNATDKKGNKYIVEFYTRLQSGIRYYEDISGQIYKSSNGEEEAFLISLHNSSIELKSLFDEHQLKIDSLAAAFLMH